MSKPAPAKEQKQTRILEAARALLVQRGFQDVALDDVARKAGVAKGTLFLYYKDKEDLFRAAFSDLVDRLGAQLEAVRSSPLEGRALLEDAARIVLEHFDSNKDFVVHGRFPGCGNSASSRLRDKMVKNLDVLAAIVERSGLARASDLDQSAAFLFGLCRSAILYNHMKKTTKPLATRRVQVVEMFLHGAGR